MLLVSTISKTYPNQPFAALQELSFTLEEGEILVVIGESGSGKSTLLKLIGGLEDLDTGEVWIDGEPVLGSAYNLVRGHPKIKMLHQDFNLLPRHKVVENIAYYLRKYSQEAQNQRIAELLAWCKLTELAHKYPAEL
jgi:ABC-type methionine transport system ATPase subunit